MARPVVEQFVIPMGEATTVFAPGTVALEVQNLQRTPDETLRAVRGPCPLIPDYGEGYPAEYGNMHGVYHASLDRGMRDVVLIRSGTRLLEQTGWTKGVKTLWGPGGEFGTTPLSDEPTAKFGDQFCEVGGKVIWTNGIDAALCYDGYVMRPLGYNARPHAPSALGPAQQDAGATQLTDTTASPFSGTKPTNTNIRRNAGHYSHPGRKGTPGDTLAGADGALLAGAFYYYTQFEDIFGNRSPLSPASGPVTLRTEQSANEYNATVDVLAAASFVPLGTYAVRIDDLTRQTFVSDIASGPEGTVARLVFVTPDTYHVDSTPRLLVRIPDNTTAQYPDNRSDAELGSAAVDYLPVPVFRVMCPYRGGLAIANTPSNPGMVLLSDPLYPGCFRSDRTIVPDPNGAEVYAVATFAGVLYAFTIDTTYKILDDAEGLRAYPVSSADGCVSPSSMCMTGLGELVWLSRDGLCAMQEPDVIKKVTDANTDTFQHTLNKARLTRAAAVWDGEMREYLVAVTEAGGAINRLLFAYDGTNVRRQRHGISYTSFCSTRDGRRLVLGCGQTAAGEDNVFVLNRVVANYALPEKTIRFRTNWLRVDRMGMGRFNVNTVYVGFIESQQASVTWRTYANGRRGGAGVQTGTMSLQPVDKLATWELTEVGATQLQNPRLYWRKFEPDLRDVDSFAFDLETMNLLHIAAFAFDVTPTDDGGRVER